MAREAFVHIALSGELCLGDSLMVLMIRPGPGHVPWHGKMWTSLIA
jgi:hypothetical protein